MQPETPGVGLSSGLCLHLLPPHTSTISCISFCSLHEHRGPRTYPGHPHPRAFALSFSPLLTWEAQTITFM